MLSRIFNLCGSGRNRCDRYCCDCYDNHCGSNSMRCNDNNCLSANTILDGCSCDCDNNYIGDGCCFRQPACNCYSCCNCRDNRQNRNLSSYVEAVGTSQTVASGGNIAFDTSESDIVGSGITLSPDGKTFTINRAGLYHVEWTLNLASGTQPVLVGIAENGELTSVISHGSETGTLSSGALINIAQSQLPYTISLRNIGGQITLQEPQGATNTVASIRISRFADGAN